MNQPREDVSGAANLHPHALRVMTFNILHDSVRNLSSAWKPRRPIVTATIRSADADVVLLQEVSQRQLEDLLLDLPEYEFIPGAVSGRTRFPSWASSLEGVAWHILGDFVGRGEQCPILVRKGRAACLDQGSFWVSPQHDESGRAWYRSPTPHIVTWARIEFSSGLICAVYNTHLGLLPWTAGHTAKALLGVLNRDWSAEPQILAGDFNSLHAWPTVRSLTANRNAGPPAFRDAWLEARSRVGSGQTFHWGSGLRGPRIDYILVRPGWPILRAMTSGAATGGVFPSDHFALIADLDPLPRP